WIEPAERGVKPGYEEKRFEEADKRGRLRLIASPDGREGSVSMHQDANLYAALVDGDEAVEYSPRPGRNTYVHVARGRAGVNGHELAAGDALKASGEPRVRIDRGQSAEILLFDLPA